MDIDQLWRAALGELEVSTSKASFKTWFSGSHIISFKDQHLLVGLPTIFHKNRFEEYFLDSLLEVLGRLSEGEITSLSAEVSQPIKENPKTSEGLFAPKEESGARVVVHEQVEPENNPALKPKYTFQTFIVGSNNQLAHAAARAASENPGETYNPLFIYGGPGLGKTHLMQAIGNAVWQKNRRATILYVSCERFTNEFIQSVSTGRTKDFKESYRTADVLLIDDIQFLIKKELTQEEFFHTFNTLHQDNKQIVLTSDRPPKAIQGLQERLISRFEWGMVVDIQSPDLETREAILISKCRERHIEVPRDILLFLATNISENVRELEGALNKVIGLQLMHGGEITVQDVQAALKELSPIFRREAPTPNHIFSTVATYYRISLDDLLGARRQKELVRPRQIAMYLLKHETNLSFPGIGKEMRGKDHTTVMHGVKKMENEIKSDSTLFQEITDLRDKLYTVS